MKTIYKYTLDGVITTVEMPKDAEVIHCGVQDGKFCIWVKVDTSSPVEHRRFNIVGTGWEISDNMCYIGTFFEGSFVWHVMEEV